MWLEKTNRREREKKEKSWWGNSIPAGSEADFIRQRKEGISLGKRWIAKLQVEKSQEACGHEWIILDRRNKI